MQATITPFHKPPNQLQSERCLNLFIWTPPTALTILYFSMKLEPLENNSSLRGSGVGDSL